MPHHPCPPVFSRTSRATRVVLWLCLAGSLSAQEAPSEAPASDEVVTLAEFQVVGQATQDGWFSSQAMVGTRTGAPVIELPYQIQVVTSEFLEDFEIIDISDQLSLFSGFSAQPAESDAAIGATASAARLRGFPVTILRDGFKRTPPPQIGSTYQIEAIKGPISTLYGMAQPGGLINYVSKRPTTRPRYTFSVSAGSYDYYRVEAFASGPLIKDKLFYMVSFEHYYRESNYDWVSSDNSNLFTGILWKPFPSSSIYVTYERQRLEGARAASFARYVDNANISAANTGHWNRDGGIVGDYFRPLVELGHNRLGPDEWYWRDYDGISVLVEHAYNDKWKQRFSYRWHEKGFVQNLLTTYDVTYLPMQDRYGYVNIYPRRRYQDITSPYSLQTDLVGRVNLFGMTHQLLFTADYAKESVRDWYMRLTAAEEGNLAIMPRSHRYLDPFNPQWISWDYDALTRRVSKDFEDLVTKGVSASDRVYLKGGDVILMANLRYDYSKFKVDSNASIEQWREGSDEALTQSYGANWRVRGDAAVLFANFSQSFNANPTYDSGTGELLPNERGRGIEFGLKSMTLDGRLGFTASYFDIEKTNIGTPNDDPMAGTPGIPRYIGIGTEQVRGVETDFNYKVNDYFTMLGNISYNDAEITESNNPYLKGARKTLVPRITSAVQLRVQFPGSWRGLSAGVGLRYTGSYVNQPFSIQGNNITYLEVLSPPLQNYTAFLRYRWRTHRFTHTVRLTGTNLADKLYVGTNGKLGLGRQIRLGYTVSYR